MLSMRLIYYLLKKKKKQIYPFLLMQSLSAKYIGLNDKNGHIYLFIQGFSFTLIF
jgi:hypothetical protein